MAERALTSGQIAVLAALQVASPKHGCLSGQIVADRRAAWARPKLEALERRGWACRYPSNAERWYVTSAGLAVDLAIAETAA